MNQDVVSSALLIAAAAGLAGLAAGLAYFAALGRTAAALAAGQGWLGRGWAGPAVWTLARFAAAAVFFGLAARQGAAPLLAAFAGFLAARAIALHAARRAG